MTRLPKWRKDKGVRQAVIEHDLTQPKEAPEAPAVCGIAWGTPEDEIPESSEAMGALVQAPLGYILSMCNS